MANANYLPVELNGQTLGFKLRNRTIDILQDVIGEENDPLAYVPKSMKWADFKEYAINILFAGLVSNIEQKKEYVTFNIDDVKQWCEDVSPDLFYTITDMYARFRSPQALLVGREANTDTRGNESSHMVGTENNSTR